MKSLGRLFSRTFQATRSERKSRAGLVKRRIQAELLERRELLAGDLLSSNQLAFHNSFAPADVTHNYRVTPHDALTVINYINRFGVGPVDELFPGKSAVEDGLPFVDVNGDGRLDPMDALMVINTLNRGQGTNMELLELRLDVRDRTTGEGLLEEGSRTLNISPGEIFSLEVGYNDLRRFGAGIGAFTVFADIFTPSEGLTFSDYIEPIVTETQELVFSRSARDGTGGNFVFTQEGNSATANVPFDTFAVSAAAAVRQGLEGLGYQPSQFQVTQLPDDAQNPQAPTEVRIRFLGDEFANQDIGNLSVDASGITGAEVTVSTIEIPALNLDGSVNSNAIPFNLDLVSRAFNNQPFYNLFTSGSFGSDGFDDVGGLGALLPDGIPNFDPLTTFDAFRIPMRFRQEVSDFVIQVGPPNSVPPSIDDAEILLYPGDPDDRLTAQDIRIQLEDDPAIPGDNRFGLVVFNVSEGLVAGTGTMTLNEDLDPPGGNTLNLLPLVSDINNTGQPISITALTQPTHGSVSLAGSVATYIPDPDYFGPDSFTYTATMGQVTATGTVNVTVVSVNDPPNARPVSIEATRGVERTIQPAELLFNDDAGPPNEDQTLTIVSVTGPHAVLNADQTITYIAPAAPAMTDTFTYTIADSDGATASTEVTVAISDLPVAPTSNNFTLTGIEGEPLNFSNADLLANVTGTPPITIITVSEASEGTLVDNGDGTYTYNAADPNLFGNVATFTYTAENDQGDSTATVTINLTAVNDPPRARDDAFTLDELSGPIGLDVLENDDPGPLEDEIDSITITGLDTAGTIGTVSIAEDGLSVIYDPGLAEPGTDSFRYTITDEGGLTASATVTITILEGVRPRAVNDETVAQESIEQQVVGIDVLGNDRPTAGQQIQLVGIVDIIQTAPGVEITINDNGTPEDRTDDFLEVTLPPFFNGDVIFTYRVEDSTGTVPSEQAATGTVTLTVDPINRPPIFGPDPARETTSNIPLDISVAELLENDSPGIGEEDSQEVFISAVQETTREGGTAVLDNGMIRYTPPLNFRGTDVIDYTISDDGDPVQTAAANLTINVVNIPPTAGADNVVAFVNIPATYPASLLLANDDAGEPEQTLTIVSASAVMGTRGQVTLLDDGSVRFVPEPDFIGETSFQYTISDGIDTTVGTVNVNVQEFQPSVIRGSVFFDDIHSLSNPVRNGIQDPGERGVSGIRVTLTSPADDNASGVDIEITDFTRASGEFRFEEVPPGRFVVQMHPSVGLIDGPDTPGTLGDLDDIENQFTIEIAQPGGADAADYHFSIISMRDGLGSVADLLSSSFLRSNPGTASSSDDGLRGGMAVLDAYGVMDFVRIDDGFEGVEYAIIALNDSRDAALLTVIDEMGDVSYARLSQSQFVLVPDRDGRTGVRFFGGRDSLDFVNNSSGLLEQEFGYHAIVDELLSRLERQ